MRLAILFLALLTLPVSAARATEPTLPRMVVTGVGGAATPGAAGIHVEWATGDGQAGRLFRADGAGPLKGVGYADAYGSIDLPGTPDGQRTLLQLQQVGLTEKVLITATVQGGKADVRAVARPAPPRETPAWLADVLKFAPFLVVAIFAILTASYLWSLRGLRDA
jgi:hypothetical protein